ncbi:MAG: SMP-30/gluconolactonase/LRE family protein [Bacteroidota bacterium]
MTAELYHKVDCKLGEGAIWNYRTQELYWVDILGKSIHIMDIPRKSVKLIRTPSLIGAIIPTQKKGTAVVGLHDGVYLVNLVGEEFSKLTSLDLKTPQVRLNDGKCDTMGRLWIGSMDIKEYRKKGKLYMVNANGEFESRLNDVTISNGLVWSLDNKTLYYIDTPTQKVVGFDFDCISGRISNGRTVIEIPKSMGFPDGMTIDEEGKLWIALWNGGAVARYDPSSGLLIETIAVPAKNITSCTFGGSNLDLLFITTARTGEEKVDKLKHPYAGSVFMVKPGIKGIRCNLFKW